MAVSNIPEGCILVGPQSTRIFIFTFINRSLTILHAMYLASNKVALNQAKSPFSYIYRKIINVHAMRYRQTLNFSILFGLGD